jgi:hypothetical protein
VAKIVTPAASKSCLCENTSRRNAVPHGLYENPFGNIIEIYSRSYELSYSAGACP